MEILPELKRNFLKFGYGINYKYEGTLSYTFHRFYVVTNVMYGNVVWLSGLSRVQCHVYSNLHRCTAIHNTRLWVH